MCQQLTPRPERVCLVVFVLLAAVPLFAQNAELSGSITDPDGLAVPGARIVVDSVETGVKRAMISNQRGECSVPALPPGGYNFTAEADRFKTTLRHGVVLAVGQRARVGFSLTLGSNTESISVLGGAPLVNISDASVSTVIGNRESPPQSRFAASEGE